MPQLATPTDNRRAGQDLSTSPAAQRVPNDIRKQTTTRRRLPGVLAGAERHSDLYLRFHSKKKGE